MDRSENKIGRIKSFDGLRFIIVIFLIFHHFDMFNDMALPGWENIMKIFTEGYFSVNFFFILSGFVIQYSYADKLRNGEVSSKQFLLNRIFHLWPLYLLCLFIALFAYTDGNVAQYLKEPHFWVHFTMLQSFVAENTYAFNFNGLAWSISNEMFFYIAFVVLVGMTEKKRHWLTVGLWGIILLNVIIIGSNTAIPNWLFYINPIFRLADFLMGMWLYDLYKKRIFEPESEKGASGMELGSIVLFICSVIVAVTGDISWEWKAQIFYTLPVCFLIYSFSFDKGIISKILGCKLFQVLGTLAFPIYLNHQICLFLVKRYGYAYIIDSKHALAAGMAAMAISIIAAIPMWYLFAKPINKKLRSMIRR